MNYPLPTGGTQRQRKRNIPGTAVGFIGLFYLFASFFLEVGRLRGLLHICLWALSAAAAWVARGHLLWSGTVCVGSTDGALHQAIRGKKNPVQLVPKHKGGSQHKLMRVVLKCLLWGCFLLPSHGR